MAGGLSIPDLCGRIGQSYMTVKQHCERLAKLGYLQRSRVPRTEVGRPEIFYRLTPKADALFPGVPVDFTLEMLDDIRLLFGENAPERLLFRYFQRLEEGWKEKLGGIGTVFGKARLLADLLGKDGIVARLLGEEGNEVVIREFHHPLRPIFKVYPQAVVMETRALEGALGTRLTRVELAGSEVDFRIHG